MIRILNRGSFAALSYSITDVDDVPAERGPHPAASIFDKRLSAKLGLARFGL
jgi:hypothetical protein